MRIIPVLDLRHGQAVHAVAGHRAHYGPLRSVLHDSTDPIALARAGRDHWHLTDLYLADLDAIVGEAPPDLSLYQTLADLGLILWVDAGIRQPEDVERLIESGVERVIVGLESVEGPQTLAEILAEFGPDRVVFSLDLFEGRPLVETRQTWGADQAEAIATMAIDLGISKIIRLDLARVGTGQGPGETPGLWDRRADWYVGGGISGIGEIERLGAEGATGVLVGSAIHDGRISAHGLRMSTR